MKRGDERWHAAQSAGNRKAMKCAAVRAHARSVIEEPLGTWTCLLHVTCSDGNLWSIPHDSTQMPWHLRPLRGWWISVCESAKLLGLRRLVVWPEGHVQRRASGGMRWHFHGVCGLRFRPGLAVRQRQLLGWLLGRAFGSSECRSLDERHTARAVEYAVKYAVKAGLAPVT